MTVMTWIREAAEAALQFDGRTQQLFDSYAETPAVEALYPLSKLGDQPQLRTVCAALIVGGILIRSHRLTRAGSRMIMAHEAATFAKDMIKMQVDRTRPRSADDKQDKKPKKGKHTSKELTSFPSGHSAGSIAVTRAFAREFPEYGAPAVGAAMLVALLQIPRCAHYTTDVAAGLAIGLLGEEATNLAWKAAGIDALKDEQD
jgi:membrane-associated phospholipid phosphatase